MGLNEVSPASDWCQRWTAGGQSWRHTSAGGFDPAEYSIDVLPEAEAKSYVTTHHYSGTFPASRLRYGLFRIAQSAIRELVGVCVLGIPTSTKALTNPFPDLEPFTESLELSRFVLADACPGNTESWFLARCFDEAAAAGVRGIVSFADPVPRVVGGSVLFPGHIGTIYQASNALYTGRATPRTLTLLPDGTVVNARAMQKVRAQERGHDHVERKLIALGARPVPAGTRQHATWLAQALADVGAVKARHGGNHRYCFKIGTRSQRRRTVVALPTTSYPKERDQAA